MKKNCNIYSICLKNIKGFILSALAVCFFLSTAGVTFAAVGTNTVSSSRTVRSWLGVPLYTVGVKGDYYFNGKEITSWTNARSANSTHCFGWSVSKQSASWIVKGAKDSSVRTCATFYRGLSTHWVEINLNSNYEEQTARVTVK